jgi:hypothetical protein
MNTKRAAPDDQVRSSRKKLKTRPEPEAEIESKPGGDHTKVESQNQVFRFLDLPGGKSYRGAEILFIFSSSSIKCCGNIHTTEYLLKSPRTSQPRLRLRRGVYPPLFPSLLPQGRPFQRNASVIPYRASSLQRPNPSLRLNTLGVPPKLAIHT